MVTIAAEWLNSCSGCEIALLNMGEPLLDLLPQLEFVHIPVLLDNKYYGPLGQEEYLHIPKATVGIISGGVRNSEHLTVLRHMRAQVDILVALGT
ncbi:MAG: methyl viologen-reducing hydrogenase, partial [Desulfovibrionaceae bacterium]